MTGEAIPEPGTEARSRRQGVGTGGTSEETCDIADDPRVDRSRGAVYRAEDAVGRVMTRADRRVRVGGQVLTLPKLVSFATLESMQTFVDSVLADPSTLRRHPTAGRVRVTAARGFRRATYRRTPGSIPLSGAAQSSVSEVRVPLSDPRGRWALTAPVLLHELAHHLVRVPGHGSEFQQTLVELYREHLGPGAAVMLSTLLAPLEGLPALSAPVDAGQLARLAALLAKAQSTDNAEEAEAYLTKAALVSQRHSIDLAVAALHAGGRSRSERPTHRMLTIGAPRAPLNKHLTALVSVIAAPFGVRVDVASGSTYVLVYGLPGDVDQVESLYATASVMMLDRAQRHVRSREWEGTSYRPPHSGQSRPVTATIARNAFCLGFTRRIGERLAAASSQAQLDLAATGPDPAADGTAARTQAGSSVTPSGRGVARALADSERVALALRARDLAVADYYRQASTARGAWRRSTTAAGSALSSRRAGERAADEFRRSRLRPGGRVPLGEIGRSVLGGGDAVGQ